jgi:hypothetical protein
MLSQSKLECLPGPFTFTLSLKPTIKVESLKVLQIGKQIIDQGGRASSLAYYSTATIMGIKSFNIQAPGVDLI